MMPKVTLFYSVLLSLCCAAILVCAQTPFDCNGRMFRVIEKQGGTVFEEITFDDTTGLAQFTERNLYFGERINGIAYHPTQNLVYGVLLGKTYRLCRIDGNYRLEKLVELPLPTGMLFVSGDISPDERYLVLLGFSPNETTNLLALVDLDPPNFDTQLIPLKTTNPSFSSIYCADIAFHPTKNELYGFDHLSGRLVTIDINERKIDNFKFPISNVLQGNVPTIFFDAFGNLFGIGSPTSGFSTNRRLYRFNVANGEIIELQKLDFEGNQDGCSCPYKVKLLNRVSQRKISACRTFELTFTVINRTDLVQKGVTFSDTLPEYFAIQSITNFPFQGKIEKGIGTNILHISDITIPVGVDSFSISIETKEDIIMGWVHNYAYLDGIFLSSKIITERIRSDDPETAIADDATTFELDKLIVDFAGQKNIICNGESLELNPKISDGITYQWSTGENTSSISVRKAGAYVVTVVTNCETATGSIEVIEDFVSVNLGETLEIERGEEIQLVANVRSGSEVMSYFWQGASILCNTCPDAVALPEENGFYSVEVENKNACKSSDRVLIQLTNFQLFRPNIFYPNSNNDNHIFYLSGRSAYKMPLFQIFDRWGNIVYQVRESRTNDFHVGWDGTFKGQEMTAGVYLWRADVMSKSGQVNSFHGEVLLHR